MWSRSGPILLFLFFLPLLTLADLPSCYRARCSHCRIQFIAQMCTQTCGSCPPQTFTNKAVNNAGTTNPVAHGKPIATVYHTAERIQTLSQNDVQPQNVFASTQVQIPTQQIPAQQVASYHAPSPQQQAAQVSQPNNFQPAQTNNFQPQYPQVSQVYNNQGQFLQPSYNQQGQFVFPTAPTLPPPSQSQQFNGFQQPNNQYTNFGQPAASQQQTSGVFNPFQPFLQNSFQSQQQNMYNPFTFPPAPTFAPFTPAPTVTLLPTMGAFPTFPPFPTHPPLTQSPQPPVTQPTPTQPNYQQNGNNNYIQSGQSSQFSQQPHQAIIVEPQRPRQLYNTQQGQNQQVPSTQGQYQVPQQPIQSPYLQPARSNSIPTVQVGNQAQTGRSIDSVPIQLEKQTYIGKGAPPASYVVDTCPKQPNWEPCISKDLANERFRNCCQRLGEGCSQLCNYDQSLTTLQLAVLTGRCPIAKVADMMICASGYEDASSCCQAYGVFEPGFEHCRPYCNPAAGLPNDGMLAEKYKCLGKLSQIQRCFYVTQKP